MQHIKYFISLCTIHFFIENLPLRILVTIHLHMANDNTNHMSIRAQNPPKKSFSHTWGQQRVGGGDYRSHFVRALIRIPLHNFTNNTSINIYTHTYSSKLALSLYIVNDNIRTHTHTHIDTENTNTSVGSCDMQYVTWLSLI